MENLGDAFIVAPGVLHNDPCFAVKRLELPGKLDQPFCAMGDVKQNLYYSRSFQLYMKWKIAREITAGLHKGSMIFRKIVNSLHPSR